MSSFPLPDRFKRGDALEANEMNQIVDAIRTLDAGGPTTESGGSPVSSPRSSTRGGHGRHSWRQAEATIVGAPSYAPTDPTLVTYTVAITETAFQIANMIPYYGRPVKANLLIWPAKIGDHCVVWRGVDSEGKQSSRLQVFSEQLEAVACPP
jgi:hypothetical protein